jgi:predicted transcriptional regulator
MVDETLSAPKRRLGARARVLRRGRIFALLREGWAYDEIASDEGVTAERIRQIVREALEKRLVDEETDHAKLQLARLQPAMRLAGEAVADGDVSAIAPLLKVLDRLDRYQRVAKVNQVYDEEARKKLFDKINRVAANLGVDEAREAAKTAEAPQGQDSGEAAGPREEKEKTPWGVGASP